MQTKEEKREYFKKYYQANKEKLAIYYKEYRENNLDKSKAYYLTNKEKMNATSKARREANKDALYTVYYLKEEHYVGVTNSLKSRLAYHKSYYNRHIEDVEVIGKYKTKEEALRVEAALHSMGYLGRHPKAKKQTLKQLL